MEHGKELNKKILKSLVENKTYKKSKRHITQIQITQKSCFINNIQMGICFLERRLVKVQNKN